MFNKKISIYLKGQAKNMYLELKSKKDKNSKTILKSVKRMIELLKENPQFGQPVPKYLIPEKYKEQGIKNVYRLEISNYWRIIYTIEGNKIEIFVFILLIADHKEYNKIFGYK